MKYNLTQNGTPDKLTVKTLTSEGSNRNEIVKTRPSLFEMVLPRAFPMILRLIITIPPTDDSTVASCKLVGVDILEKHL